MSKEESIQKKYQEQLLFDFYGELLSSKLKLPLSYYYNDDYSATEIAEIVQMTRQGAYDAIRRGRNQLQKFENKLHLVERFEKTKILIANIETELDELQTDEMIKQSPVAIKTLKKLSKEIDDFKDEY
ncbi:DNA-binding protein [uncultured Pseudoramibacter sp.]|uniref:DNA-binding protein n=1 Tax=uncultured Pseudoramibacter sp. TaxID=1623493 RepID=UPI0025DF4280|nr:DNA-binding protein [uncultured Pseudoramibacter sp.]